MLLYALAVLPIVFVGSMHGLWTVVAVISLACAAHQAWSANIFSLVSDIFPRRAVASVTGMAGCGGAIAGGFANGAVGLVVQAFHSYVGIFIACGLAYLTAWLIIQFLTRKPELTFAE